MIASMANCPICGRPAAARAENRAFPFCSVRCKKVDLGSWLDERYRVPVADVSGEGDPGSDAGYRPQEEA
jgi:endogenous inhibitor of DNA gyrase (YacG/DUF329 family)